MLFTEKIEITFLASESNTSTISGNSFKFSAPLSTIETSTLQKCSVLSSTPCEERKFQFSSVVQLSSPKQFHTETENSSVSSRVFTFSAPTSVGHTMSTVNKVI